MTPEEDTGCPARGVPLLPSTAAVAALALLRAAGKHLPRSIFRVIHAPLDKSLRSASLLEQIKDESPKEEFPPHFHFDARLSQRWKRHYLGAAPQAFAGVRTLRLRNVKVLPDGCIIAGGRIHPWSAVYHRTSLTRLLEASVSGRPDSNCRRAPKASIVSRSLITEGTFGDYVIEFLLPFSWAAERLAETTLLLDADFAKQHAPPDLAKLGLRHADVPPGGIFVDELTVVGPCQAWDNFRPANIEKTAALFPAQRCGSTPEKIYLSRVGLPESRSQKQSRCLHNEEEIEAMLSQEGFDILRTHLLSNEVVRGSLARAKIVVANHGAAMTHLIWGRPKHVVELATEEWWVPCYSKLCRALDVDSYSVLCANQGRLDADELRSLVSSIS